jgi:hypothetical protein
MIYWTFKVTGVIVSVQPLMGPTGLPYYLRWKYSQHGNQETPVLQPAPKYRSIDDPWITSSNGWKFENGEWKER